MLKSLINKRNVVLLSCMLGSAFTSSHALAEAATTQVTAVQALPTQQVVQAQAGVNINTATATEIAEALKGVGIAKAEAIVAFRDLNGAFLQLEEITQVKGIGAATLEKNKAAIRFQ